MALPQGETELFRIIEHYRALSSITTAGRNRETEFFRLEELVGDRERWKDITAASVTGRAYRMIA